MRGEWKGHVCERRIIKTSVLVMLVLVKDVVKGTVVGDVGDVVARREPKLLRIFSFLYRLMLCTSSYCFCSLLLYGCLDLTPSA